MGARMRALMSGCIRRCIMSVLTGRPCCCRRSNSDRFRLKPLPDSICSLYTSAFGRSCSWSPVGSTQASQLTSQPLIACSV